jgi:imidazolonepropionase-like amidohydrolase
MFFSDGKIATVGSTQYVRELWKDDNFEEVIDATGKCVLPGFVDAHTHPVWTGDRLDEFAMKVLQFLHYLCNTVILSLHSAVRKFLLFWNQNVQHHHHHKRLSL